MAKQILSCDWGTSAFRLRLLQVDDRHILNEVVLEKGIAAVYDEWLQTQQPENERSDFYRAFLQSVINTNFPPGVKALPVIISGMASSTIGMKELPYKKVPFDIKRENLITHLIPADDICPHDILLVSGLRTDKDVMRGEETMLIGCELDNEDEALVIFPGTHSKHISVQQNIVPDFKTYMTGEFFELLTNKSVVSKSVKKNNNESIDSFNAGVKDGAYNSLLNSAFHVRTNHLFKKFTAEENYHYLSGLVIGNELKDAVQAHKNIHLVCSKNLSKQYMTALKILTGNNPVTCHDADEALISGHCKLSVLLNL